MPRVVGQRGGRGGAVRVRRADRLGGPDRADGPGAGDGAGFVAQALDGDLARVADPGALGGGAARGRRGQDAADDERGLQPERARLVRFANARKTSEQVRGAGARTD